jgi:hypothetical protein
MKKALPLRRTSFQIPLGTSWLSPHLGGDRNPGGRALAPSLGALRLDTVTNVKIEINLAWKWDSSMNARDSLHRRRRLTSAVPSTRGK